MKPALQAGINFDHASGLYAGAAVSNVDLDRDAKGLGALIYGGYAHPIGTRASWDAGVVTYVYPSPQRGPDYNYTEAHVGVSLERVNARIYFSDDYYGTGVSTAYAEINVAQPVGERVTLLAHVGYIRYLETYNWRGPAGHTDFKAGINVDVGARFNVELSVTAIDNTEHCITGRNHCGTAAVFSLSRTF
jgi:uncharacterized protein (TIGR02001 family)